MKHSIPVSLRFWSRVRKSPGDGCWTWTGAFSDSGYGEIRVGSKIVGAHVYAYRTRVGDIPKGMLVCHRCDNPKCVRPDHLFLGTYTDNNRDMTNKGRQRGPDWGRLKHPSSKFSDEDVRTIRQRGKLETPSDIARDYGVQRATIRRILAWETYKNVV